MSAAGSNLRARRGRAAGLLVGAALALSAVPAYALTPQVSPGGGPPYPARTLVLTAPGPPLVASQVHVLENGHPVGGLLVRPLSHARKGDYGVILVIDRSASMAGGRIAQAMNAARGLAAGLSANQEIGVIEFNRGVRVVLPLTADAAAITRALAATPTTSGGTHIFDAVAVAERELVAARIAAGSVIVVSGGDDHGSHLNANEAAAPGLAPHYAVYTVAVSHPNFGGEDLAELAVAGHGTFVAAQPSQLHQTLLALQARLISRYVLHYRSLLPLGVNVHVTVTITGVAGAGRNVYSTPATPHAVKHHSFWTSNTALLIYSGGGALLIALAAVFLLAPRWRKEGVRTRVARFTDLSELRATVALRLPGGRGTFAEAERSLRESPRWERFGEILEIAGIEMDRMQVAAITSVGTLALALLVALAIGSPFLALPVLIIGPLVAWAIVQQRLRRQRTLFTDALPGHLQEIASALRAGHSMGSAFAVTAEGASEPSRREFRRVVADEQLGKPLDAALAPVAARMACPDIGQLGLVASLNDRTGGNMAEVLDRLAEAVRERSELRRDLAALTAQARLSRYVVTALPPGVLAIVAIVNPGYVQPLFHTSTGVLLLMLATTMVIVASVVMRKIVNIKV